jgi:hypothetical protein
LNLFCVGVGQEHGLQVKPWHPASGRRAGQGPPLNEHSAEERQSELERGRQMGTLGRGPVGCSRTKVNSRRERGCRTHRGRCANRRGSGRG